MLKNNILIKYTIRKAKPEDLATLDRIHTENMKGYVEKIYPWNATLFRDSFIPDEYTIIEIQSNIVGFTKIVTTATEIYLAEIQIRSHYQNRGIGSSLIHSVIKQAEDNPKRYHRRLWLKVIKGNPAQKLYQRLGFMVFEESPTHLKMAKNLA